MRALLLDRVLRCEDEERSIERIAHPANGDLILLHRLEECRLRARRRAIDLVGKNDVGEDGTRNEPNVALSRGNVLFDHFGAQDVGWHQIRGELNSAELELDSVGQRLDEECFCQAWNATQKAVASRKQADQYLA